MEPPLRQTGLHITPNGAPPRPPPKGARPRVLRFMVKWMFVAMIWAVAAFGVLLAIYASDLPDVHQVAGLKKRPGLTLLAADGSMIARSGDLYGETLPLSRSRIDDSIIISGSTRLACSGPSSPTSATGGGQRAVRR